MGFADVCRGAIVFFNPCMSLLVPAPLFTAERHFLPQPAALRGSSSTIRNSAGLHSIPQERPGGTADNLEPHRHAWTRSRVHVVKMIGIKQKHMVCSLQAGLHTDGHLSGAIWVNECSKREFLGAHIYRRQIGKRSSPFSVAAQLPGPHTSDAFQQEAELCDRQHTVQNAARAAGALMLRCWP